MRLMPGRTWDSYSSHSCSSYPVHVFGDQEDYAFNLYDSD